jgi:cellulose synthase/poly-beta-1,6-N-acetylglucosamine synthase-like glycosyltransferase
MAPYHEIYHVLEAVFFIYFLVYNSLNLVFIALSLSDVRRRIIGEGFEDLDVAMASPLTPPLSIIIPAYNEETTIVESTRALLNSRFPRLEIIIVNDGSTDSTLDLLKRIFFLKRIDIDYREQITTAPVKGFYESMARLPERITRFVVIDKDNGGRADAVNAGINASRCPYFMSIDADSILDDAALLQTFRIMLQNADVVGVGGQVAIVNGCIVKNGRVVERRMPKSNLARFQIVEYVRSFTMGRTAFARLDALLIISGAFGVFQKEFVQRIGGYLTRFLTSKINVEYGGVEEGTVCEDMEITVRSHRYIREKGLRKTITYIPHPLCWTEVPETIASLSKQRNRWQRGLIESLRIHRTMFFNRDYGRVGLFAIPYYVIFELLGAPVELLGYICLPVLFVLDDLSFAYAVLFFGISVGYGILLSVASIVISAWPERTSETDISGSSLLYFKKPTDILILVLYGILENFGYRQLTLWWRTRGIVDYFRGKRGWDKFERKGFVTHGGNIDAGAAA